MHIHILGICGTFMAGIAILAKSAGFKVTGSDQNVYPPMSTKLKEAGIEIIEGYGAEQLDLNMDLIVVGNVMKRGMPVIERMLNEDFNYVSGPQWLCEHYLKHKTVLAVAGTHGKTTTSSMLAYILDRAGLNPSFLIGGVPGNFDFSARNTDSKYFVIEADEYDSAFFDKRSKFIHYRPTIALLNNLEYDHADIFDSVEDIKKQFHFLVRTIKGQGHVVFNSLDHNLQDVIKKGVWSNLTSCFDTDDYHLQNVADDYSNFDIYHKQEFICHVDYSLTGIYNAYNTLMAMVCANKLNVPFSASAEYMQGFILPKRRMELKASIDGVSLYDDFAHHPTAIKLTTAGLRAKIGATEKIIAVFEPRSNSMKLGAHKDMLPFAFESADMIYIYANDAVNWDAYALEQQNTKIKVFEDFDQMLEHIVTTAKAAAPCSILVMSNGGFNGICSKLINLLENK